MKNGIKILIFFIGLLVFSCSPEYITNENPTMENYAKTSGTTSMYWDFTSLDQWIDASQNGPGYYQINDGILKIFTHANTWERSKVKTLSNFADGTYSWNVFVPEMGAGDMTAIGAFLYNDDTHELDFEIGYGNQTLRSQLAAESDDLIVYMSSQAKPSISIRKKIKMNQWYNLKLELKLNSKGRYVANWKIDDAIMATAQLNYGDKTKFNIFCSVENLQFIGDHIPQQQNYALFESVEFNGSLK